MMARARAGELEGGERALLFLRHGAASAAYALPGQRVLAPRALYWALRNWLREFCVDWGLTLDWYANDDLDESGPVDSGRAHPFAVDCPRPNL